MKLVNPSKAFTLFLVFFMQLSYASTPQITGEVIDQTTLKKIQKFKFTLESVKNPLSRKLIRYKSGVFKDVLLNDFEVGEKVRIVIPGGYWDVVDPINGYFFIPQKNNFNKISIKVIRSDLLLNNQKIEDNNQKQDSYSKNTPIYAVQIFSGSSKNKAMFAMYNLIDKGHFSACIQQKKLDENTFFYRVFSGKYERKERAYEVKKYISQSKYFSNYKAPFVVKIRSNQCQQQ